MFTRSNSLLLIALVLLAAPVARAHDVGLSQGSYQATADGLRVELTLARADAAVWPGDEALAAAVDRGLAVASEHGPCTPGDSVLRPEAADGVTLLTDYRCVGPATHVDARFVGLLARGHRHVAYTGGQPEVLRARAERLDLTSAAPAAPAASAYLPMGIEHVLIGADHLAFLFALVLIGLRRRDALLVVTSFTVGHSLTLALAALNVVSLSPSIVEPLIAASIAWVGIENMWRPHATSRWRLAAPFGLVHGLGFAGVLHDIGLPTGDEVPALLWFNGGVEVGQLLVLVAVLPLLAVGRRSRWFREVGVGALSAAIVGLGVVWFIERVL